uniref:G-protein coupled receptors family 1 profile domain-containing protein n=1 Tax=Panagrolaimus sp. JU765 TaxID=591449 RepID=A0AC34PUK7_9BILA
MKRLVSLPWSIFFGSLFVGLTTIGLLGNIFVIIVISGDRKMRKSVMNMLLLNLAVADALNLITTTVEWVPTTVFGHPAWVFPNFMCPLARYFECVFLFSSILTQLVVCVERYIAIVYPIHAKRLCSRRNILLTIMSTWVFVFFLAFPYALYNEKRPNSRVCANPYMHTSFWSIYKWIEFTNFYFLPCIIFIFLYTKVCRVLWSKNKQLYEETNTLNDVSARSDALIMRRNVVKMLVACVSVYFICYSPIEGMFLSKALFNITVLPPYEVVLCLNALAVTCSACNPLLYTLFSKKFRTKITGLLSYRPSKRAVSGRTIEITYSFSKGCWAHQCQRPSELNSLLPYKATQQRSSSNSHSGIIV